MTRYGNSNGFFELNPFPGSNQIVISNHAFVKPELRGEGVGQEEHVKRLQLARELGYDYIICTVMRTNDVQRHILDKNGWRPLDTFVSTETGHEVVLYGKRLTFKQPKTYPNMEAAKKATEDCEDCEG